MYRGLQLICDASRRPIPSEDLPPPDMENLYAKGTAKKSHEPEAVQ